MVQQLVRLMVMVLLLVRLMMVVIHERHSVSEVRPLDARRMLLLLLLLLLMMIVEQVGRITACFVVTAVGHSQCVRPLVAAAATAAATTVVTRGHRRLRRYTFHQLMEDLGRFAGLRVPV